MLADDVSEAQAVLEYEVREQPHVARELLADRLLSMINGFAMQ